MSTDQNVELTCNVCGTKDNLMKCSRCKIILYCSKEHQKKDWKKHKVFCGVQPINNNNNNHTMLAASVSNKQTKRPVSLPVDGSSEIEILNTSNQFSTERTLLKGSNSEVQVPSDNIIEHKHKEMKLFPEIRLNGSSGALQQQDMPDSELETMCNSVIQDLNEYGVCVLDDFIGYDKGKKVLDEVLRIKEKGVLRDGQLVSMKGIAKEESKNIRGDQICWVSGNEDSCKAIRYLIQRVDSLVTRANKINENGTLGHYIINSRTNAMVACYPGSGARYVKHVDNPNKDGRCITVIYYLNLNWDIDNYGGLLRVFPEGELENQVADVAPLFDRLILFWSDRRNPHEVQPAFNTRYAITLWYFDAKEREEAFRRYLATRKLTSTAGSQMSPETVQC